MQLHRRGFLSCSLGAVLPPGPVSAAGKLVEGKEVVAAAGAVGTEPPDAARVGARVLAAGGNAMDAAAAAVLASCVLQPETSDIGGYVCCALVLEGRSGRVFSLDANSVAPAAAHERMYQVLPLEGHPGGLNANEYNCAVKDDANVYGPLAVGVPGVMGGIGFLWERWGNLKWTQIVEPSQRLLADGFPYRTTARAIQQQESVIRKFEATARHLMPDGRVPSADDVWHRRDLEKTLARLAAAGWRDFYDGEIGRTIVDYIARAGGILTRADLAAFRPRVREPHTTTYRKAKAFAANLPNGGLSTLQMLNMLECFEPLDPREVRYWHRLAEILKLGWRDRLRYLGDPEFAKVPVERLLSKDYAAGRVEMLRQFPDAVDKQKWPSPGPIHGTVHLSAADAEGNLVAATFTHGGLFGSCLTVPGTGILLGHGMCRFDPHPGGPNSVGARKRPLNNVAPTILRLPDRDVALGLRGGRRIVSVSFQLSQRVVDGSAAAFAAASAPRMHVSTEEPVEMTESADRSIVQSLVGMGHEVKVVAAVGGSAHIAEILKEKKMIRVGGGGWVAGI